MSRGRYFLGRVIKQGLLDQDKLMEAILNSPVVEIGKFDWSITDAIDGRSHETPFIFGKLSKYAKNGHVTVVDEYSKSQVNALAQNLVEASSPFVYLPEYSGIAFLQVWNGIGQDIFPKRFKKIIEEAHGGFFVNCEIEPVADYREFASKLKEIKNFTEISARVFPPNPLFGRLWESLHDYIKRRNVADVSVKEAGKLPVGINTNILNLVTNIISDPQFQPNQPADITDAAILMAADGYGNGKIIGHNGDIEIIVKTSDTQKSFLFSKEPLPFELASIVEAQLHQVSYERDMRH
ncbi:hypothetical protein [uncultured Deefgea sp.]|uniref:hypothetical protein n=1 Tax=uncultured Deefgea sp. TaxID=1304914 RepID=UPI0025979591|nr:hypothetical protein [uncultured Deefgea sp.]